MKRTVFLFTLITLACFSSLKSQNVNKGNGQSEMTSSGTNGKVIATFFGRVGASFNNYQGIDCSISRAYLGYRYKFSREWSASVIGDFAADRDLSGHYYPYLKNAFFSYSPGKFSLSAGLINLFQFELVQSYWGHRYVEKTLQDFFGLGNSADVGVRASYEFSPLFMAESSITNGFGFKHITSSRHPQYSLAFNFTPDKFVMRVYGDVKPYSEKDNITVNEGYEGGSQWTAQTFIGYKDTGWRGGIEYVHQENNKFNKGHLVNGLSCFGSMDLTSKWSLFARADYVHHSDFYISNATYLLAGFDYKPIKYISLSSNLRYLKTDKDDTVGLFVNLSLSY